MKYKIMTRTACDKIIEYVVTDQPDNYDPEWGATPYPYVVSFKVSLRHDKETQERRAYEYRDYLNRGIIIQAPIGS